MPPHSAHIESNLASARKTRANLQTEENPSQQLKIGGDTVAAPVDNCSISLASEGRGRGDSATPSTSFQRKGPEQPLLIGQISSSQCTFVPRPPTPIRPSPAPGLLVGALLAEPSGIPARPEKKRRIHHNILPLHQTHHRAAQSQLNGGWQRA